MQRVMFGNVMDTIVVSCDVYAHSVLQQQKQQSEEIPHFLRLGASHIQCGYGGEGLGRGAES